MASAQCQAGLWTKAANTLVEAISKWPEEARDPLDTALDQVQVRREGGSHTGLEPGSIAYPLNPTYRTWREVAWVPHTSCSLSHMTGAQAAPLLQGSGLVQPWPPRFTCCIPETGTPAAAASPQG